MVCVVPAGRRRAGGRAWRDGRGGDRGVGQVGEVVPEPRRARRRRGTSRGGRGRREQQDRGRRVGDRVATCGRCRRPIGRGALGGRDRARLRRPRLRRRSTGRSSRGSRRSLVPGRRSRRREREAADDALAETLAAVRPDARRPRRLHADPRARASLGGVPRPDPQRPPGAAAGVPRARTPSRDALAAGVAVTGVTVHLVDDVARRRPDRRSRRRSPVLPGDDEETLLARIHAVEHRLLPRAVGAAPGRGARRSRDGRRVGDRRRPRRTERCRCRGGRCCRSPTRPAWSSSGRGLVRAGLRAGLDRRHGAGAARRGPAGDRRRRGHRLPGDARRAGQDAPPAGPRRHPGRPAAAPTTARQLAAAGDRAVRARRRQPLPVRRGRRAAGHHVRRAGRGDRHRRAVDGPGRGQEPRLGRDRDLARRGTPAVLAALRRAGEVGAGPALGARGRGVPPHRRLRRADRRRAARPHGRGRRRAARRAGPAAARPTRTRRRSSIGLEKVETLRYGENPHQPAARYRRPGATEAGRAVRAPASRRSRARRSQLQQRARRLGRGGARPAACAARPASSSSTRTRAAPPSAPRSLEAWDAALAGDPVSAYGGVVALTRHGRRARSPSG